MNRKLLALLLLLPMLMFAVDQAFGSAVFGPSTTDGPGDKKKKPSTTTEVPRQATPSSSQLDEWAGIQTDTPEEKATEKPDYSQMSLLETIHAKYATDNVDWEDETAPLHAWEQADYEWQYALEEQLENFLDTHLLEAVRKADPAEFDADEIMSRCPSGYRIIVYQDADGGLTDRGEVLVESGCWSRSMGQFRYDVAAQSVEMYVSEKFGYLSVKDYLRAYGEAIG